jgi:hypothetical protein
VRRLTLRDLPAILRNLRAPRQVRAALGDYSADPQTGQYGGTDGDYNEMMVMGCSPDDINALNAYGVDGGSLGALQNTAADTPGFGEINWTATTYTSGAGAQNIKFTANPNRVLLIVENVSTITPTANIPVAVNFGQNASTEGPAPNGVQLLTRGSVLYVDEKCPTNDVYLHLPVTASPDLAVCVVVIGQRGAPASSDIGGGPGATGGTAAQSGA